MKNYLLRAFALITILYSCTFATMAQSTQTSSSSDEINRVEFFGGFSHNRALSPYLNEDLQAVDQSVLGGGNQLEQNLGGRYGANGANFSITGNLTKYFGLKFDVSTHRNKRSFTAGTSNLEQKYSLTNFLGGIQIKNNEKDGPRVKPFFHALVGAARQNVRLRGLSGALSSTFGANELNEKQTNLAFAVGGGVDVRVHRHVDLRLIQVDFNPTYVKETDNFEGKFQSNVRFGFGIVIH